MKLKKTFALLPVLLLCGATGAFAQTDITNTAGGTVTAQYVDSPTDETIVKLVDNSPVTKFLLFRGGAWVQYQATQPYLVTKYALTSANDVPERDPKEWTLEGSNDSTTWATLDTRSNQTFTARTQRREFSFDNEVLYSHYRLNLTSAGGTMLQLAELELYGVAPEIDDDAQSDITDLPGEIGAQHVYKSSNRMEGLDKVIDNQAATKYPTSNAQAWIQFRSANPSVVTRYSITSANDFPERDPQKWLFQGSNDGITWTTLDARADQDFATRFFKREFTFNNTKAYSYYRLNMANHGGNILQLSEWEIFGTGVVAISLQSKHGRNTGSTTLSC
jgi:hypothetical protein